MENANRIRTVRFDDKKGESFIFCGIRLDFTKNEGKTFYGSEFWIGFALDD